MLQPGETRFECPRCGLQYDLGGTPIRASTEYSRGLLAKRRIRRRLQSMASAALIIAASVAVVVFLRSRDGAANGSANRPTSEIPVPSEGRKALPTTTNQLLDLRVGATIIVALIKADSDTRPRTARLQAKSLIKVKVDDRLRRFQVIRPWQGAVMWKGGEARLLDGPAGLTIMSEEPFFLGPKRMLAGTILLREREGWQYINPIRVGQDEMGDRNG